MAKTPAARSALRRAGRDAIPKRRKTEMKTCRLLGSTALLTLLVPAIAWADVPPVPATPAAIDDLVYARPFTLEKGYEFEWRQEKPQVTEGYILVLKVNPDLVYPRQCAEPVLYVGDQTAERVNVGYESGHVIAIVPGEIKEMDLAKTLIWFGTPELPERCTAKTIAAEKALAEKAGIKPLKKSTIAAARKTGAEQLDVKNRDKLRRKVAALIKRYAADEADLADGLLAPRSE
jgi:hypothetical protein